MEQKLIGCFKKAAYEPNENLCASIWQTIALRQKRMTQLKLWVFSLTGLISLSGLVPAINRLSNDLAHSGFWKYVSLAFSNIPSATSYWKEFAFSIAESLPLTSIILSLGLVFIFFISLRYAMKQVVTSQLSASF